MGAYHRISERRQAFELEIAHSEMHLGSFGPKVGLTWVLIDPKLLSIPMLIGLLITFYQKNGTHPREGWISEWGHTIELASAGRHSKRLVLIKHS